MKIDIAVIFLLIAIKLHKVFSLDELNMGEAKCKAWTYVKPGIVGNKAPCRLKNKAPPPLQDGNCLSGVKK
jgi:hypothetical protein